MQNVIKNRIDLKKKFLNRDNLFGGWVSFGHPSITEIFTNANFDFLAIDMEHSTISLNEAQRIISSSQAGNLPCLPRPVSHSNDWFKPILDSGADGLILPTVENEKEHLVAYGLSILAKEQLITSKHAKDAMKKYNIDTNKPMPTKL